MKNGLFPAWRNWVQADYYYSTTTVNDFNDRLLICGTHQWNSTPCSLFWGAGDPKFFISIWIYFHLYFFLPKNCDQKSEALFCFHPSFCALTVVALDVLFSLAAAHRLSWDHPDWHLFHPRTLLAGHAGDLCSSCFPKAGSRAWKIAIFRDSEVLEAAMKKSPPGCSGAELVLTQPENGNVEPWWHQGDWRAAKEKGIEQESLGICVCMSLQTPPISFNVSGLICTMHLFLILRSWVENTAQLSVGGRWVGGNRGFFTTAVA